MRGASRGAEASLAALRFGVDAPGMLLLVEHRGCEASVLDDAAVVRRMMRVAAEAAGAVAMAGTRGGPRRMARAA